MDNIDKNIRLAINTSTNLIEQSSEDTTLNSAPTLPLIICPFFKANKDSFLFLGFCHTNHDHHQKPAKSSGTRHDAA